MSCPPLCDQNKWLEQGDGAAETALWSRAPQQDEEHHYQASGLGESIELSQCRGLLQTRSHSKLWWGITPCRNIMRSPESAEQAENSYSTDM